MAINKQNLKIPTSEEARKNGRKGGLASVEARRKAKSAREFAEAALNAEVEDKKTGIKVVAKDAIIQGLIYKAINDKDLNTVKYIFELIGESPTQKLDVTTNGMDIGTQLIFSPTPLTEKDIQEIKDIQNGAKKDSNDSSISEA